MYKDVAEFTGSCEKCQIYSGVRHRDELQPTFSPTINFKWMVDIEAMPTGIGQKKYLVTWEDLMNQVEGPEKKMFYSMPISLGRSVLQV